MVTLMVTLIFVITFDENEEKTENETDLSREKEEERGQENVHSIVVACVSGPAPAVRVPYRKEKKKIYSGGRRGEGVRGDGERGALKIFLQREETKRKKRKMKLRILQRTFWGCFSAVF